LILKFLKN